MASTSIPKPPRRRGLALAAGLAALLAAGGALRLREAAKPADLREFWLGQWDYYGLGTSLARRGDFGMYPGAWPTAFRLPLYPAFVAAVARLSPGLASLRLAQASLDTAVIGGVALLGAAAGGPEAGLAAAAFYALSPARAARAAEVAVEPFLTALVVLAALGLAWWSRREEDARRAAAAGAAIGLSLFCRSTLAFLPVLAALGPCLRRKGFWRSRALAAFLAAAYLPLLPWALRNYRLFGAFVPLERGAASANLWAASAGAVRAVNDLESSELGPEGALYAEVHDAGEDERSRRLLAAAAGNIAARPGRYLLAALRRLPVFWSEQWLWLLLAAGVFAAPLGAETGVLLLVAAYFNIHVLMAVQPRYARPAEGALLALAACGALALGRRLARPRRAAPERLKDAPLGRALAAGLAAFGGLYLLAARSLALEAGRYPAGVGAVPRAYEAAPGLYAELKSLHDRSVASAVRGDWEGAEKGFDAVLGRSPLFGESLISRAVARERQGRPAAARRDYEEALRLLENGTWN